VSDISNLKFEISNLKFCMKLLPLISLVILLIGCDRPTDGQPATRPTSAPAKSPVAFGAITYFNAHCMNCHGPAGSFFGEKFVAKKRSDEELKKMVKDMAEGPGQEPLDDEPLETVTAFHRSLLDGKPFVSITERTGTKISGEVSPGASVTVIAGDQTVSAQVKDHEWSAEVKAAPLRVIAKLKDRETTLDVSQPHSHSAIAR
jgi:hypothetical protein